MCGGGGGFVGGIMGAITGAVVGFITGGPVGAAYGAASGFAGGVVGGPVGMGISIVSNFGLQAMVDESVKTVATEGLKTFGTEVTKEAMTEAGEQAALDAVSQSVIDKAAEQGAQWTMDAGSQAVANGVEGAVAGVAETATGQSLFDYTADIGAQVLEQQAQAAGYATAAEQGIAGSMQGQWSLSPDMQALNPEYALDASIGQQAAEAAAKAAAGPGWELNRAALDELAPGIGTGTGPGEAAGLDNLLSQKVAIARLTYPDASVGDVVQKVIQDGLKDGTISAAQAADLSFNANYGNLEALRNLPGGGGLASSMSAAYPQNASSVIGRYGAPGGVLSSAESNTVLTPMGKLAAQTSGGMYEIAASGLPELTAKGALAKVADQAALPIVGAAAKKSPVLGALASGLELARGRFLPPDNLAVSRESMDSLIRGGGKVVDLAQNWDTPPTVTESVLGNPDVTSLYKRAPGLRFNNPAQPDADKPREAEAENTWNRNDSFFNNLATFGQQN